MSLTLSGSSALQRVKLGDALEICNGIIFNFYLGLPHIIGIHLGIHDPVPHSLKDANFSMVFPNYSGTNMDFGWVFQSRIL